MIQAVHHDLHVHPDREYYVLREQVNTELELGQLTSNLGNTR